MLLLCCYVSHYIYKPQTTIPVQNAEIQDEATFEQT